MPSSPLPEGVRRGGRFGDWAPARPAYLVADVDGTLIARGTTATPVVAEAVREAHETGLRVGFATGRLPVGMDDLHGQLQPEGPHVVHNGAQVREGGRPLHTWPLPPGAAQQVVEICGEFDLYGEFYVGEDLFVTDRREAVRPVWEQISGEPDGLVTELDLATTETIKGTLIIFEGADVPDVLARLQALGLASEASFATPLPAVTFANVTSPEADKGRGVAFVAEYLGIGTDAIVAVGDGPNDLSMLAVAGTAIAMGQAPAEVHEAAHVIVPEVEADGVAHALRAAAEWRRALA
jgi:Cof subfamily protein (haloacid dehalogenase superfamily)